MSRHVRRTLAGVHINLKNDFRDFAARVNRTLADLHRYIAGKSCFPGGNVAERAASATSDGASVMVMVFFTKERNLLPENGKFAFGDDFTAVAQRKNIYAGR